MNRITSALVAVLVLVGTIGAFPAAATPTATPGEVQTEMSVGDRLSAVVGVQQAEFEGEIDARAFDVELANATSADARAKVVAARLERSRQRLAALEGRKERLQRARERGEISDGAFQARAAALAAQSAAVERAAEQSDAAADELPATVLRANGVNVTAISTLRTDASELTGPEVAAVARTITGPGAVDEKRPGDRSPNATGAMARAEREVQDARTQLERIEVRVNRTNASENATAALDLAREQLASAERALERARGAQANGNADRAAELAERARELASDAAARAEEAGAADRDASRDGDRGRSDEDHAAGSRDTGEDDASDSRNGTERAGAGGDSTDADADETPTDTGGQRN